MHVGKIPATGNGLRQGKRVGGRCQACGVATRRLLLGVLLPPLTIALATLTAGALLLTAALLVPPPLPVASELVPPVVTRAARSEATSTILGQSTRVTLPRTPAAVALARLTYAPGAGGSHRALIGPMLLLVESGAITVQLNGGAHLLRDAQAQPVAGGDLVLQPGDGLVLPWLTEAAFRNRGAMPAVALVAGVFPSGANVSTVGRVGMARWAETWSPGASVQPLAGGWLQAETNQAATLTVQRVMLPAGASLPLSAHGPVDLAVEIGALTLEARTGMIWKQPLDGTNQYIAPASKATLLPGDAALLQSAAEVTLRNDGTGPLAVLALSVEFVAGDIATAHVVTTPDPRAALATRLRTSAPFIPTGHPNAPAHAAAPTQPTWDETDPWVFLTQMAARQRRKRVPIPVGIDRLPSRSGSATPVVGAPCHSVVSCSLRPSPRKSESGVTPQDGERRTSAR